MVQLTRQSSRRKPNLKIAEERREMAEFLKAQRGDERDRAYRVEHLSRGVSRTHLGLDDSSYNEIHSTDFYRQVEETIKNKGRARVLDVGCGLGYFVRDLLEHAEEKGFKDKLEVHGLALTRTYKCEDPDTGRPKEYKPVVGKKHLHVGHAENIPFPDESFDLVVSSMGPWTYYYGPAGSISRGRQLMDELYRVTDRDGKIFLGDRTHPNDVYSNLALNRFTRSHADIDLVKNNRLERYTSIQLIKRGEV